LSSRSSVAVAELKEAMLDDNIQRIGYAYVLHTPHLYILIAPLQSASHEIIGIS
jgi:hypothetical protein